MDKTQITGNEMIPTKDFTEEYSKENEERIINYYLYEHENKELNNKLCDKCLSTSRIDIEMGEIFYFAYHIYDCISTSHNRIEDTVADLSSMIHKKLRETYRSDDIINKLIDIEDPLTVHFSLAFASAYVLIYNSGCPYKNIRFGLHKIKNLIEPKHFERFEPLLKKDINTSDLPTTEEYIQEQVKNKYEVFVSEVQKYGFSDLDMVKCLSKSQQSMLIDKIIGNDANYSVPMLVHIGFYKKLGKEYNLKDKNIFEIWSKALQKCDRTIKGQFNALKPTSKEDKSRYNSEINIDKVASDYKDIAATNH